MRGHRERGDFALGERRQPGGDAFEAAEHSGSPLPGPGAFP